MKHPIYRLLLLSLGVTASLGAQSKQTPTAPAKDWHHTYQVSAQGTRADEALAYLRQRGKRPRPILVAVVDTGVDTTLQEIRPALYLNPKELPDGRDNDRDGYVDNRYGWNFLGSPDGSIELTSVGTTAFREYKRLLPRYKGLQEAPVGQEQEYAYFRQVAREAGIARYEQLHQLTSQQVAALHLLDRALGQLPQLHLDTLTLGGLLTLPLTEDSLEQAGERIAPLLFKHPATTPWRTLLSQTEHSLQTIERRLASIEGEPDKRTLLGDDLSRLDSRSYGNGRVSGQGQEHGTFVASLIAGQGTIDPAVRGIYPEAKLLTLRAVPDRGDEYDKDVAAAIVYAVDHGAKVINLSLGKDLSPSAHLVEEALQHALRHDVLVIHSSGNNGRDLDRKPIYPSGRDASGKPFPNYLRVGASTPEGTRAPFSNYGASVLLYAPGQGIYGTMPGGEIDREDGTSLAAPIVSGIAAMLRAYFPKLSAPALVRLLLQSARSGEVPLVDALAAAELASHPPTSVSR